MLKTRLQQLADHGQSVWLDYLSRDILEDGKLAGMMERAAGVGVRSRRHLAQKHLSSDDAYGDQLTSLLVPLQRHEEVRDAYVRGLERFVGSGGDPSTVRSVASFFVSRVDTEADKRLEKAGPSDLQGKLAVANAKLAYQDYKRVFSGDRWERLAAKGANTQRCLWASTSTKNPAYRDVLYVEELIGPETVDTMPEETIVAFQDHGEVALTLEQDLDEAKRVFERIAEAGVDYDDVVAVLEQEGVQKFADSFAELLDGVRAKRGELVSA